MSVDNSYQPGIYREQGGNKLVVKSNGTIEVNGTLTVAEGATVTGILDASQVDQGLNSDDDVEFNTVTTASNVVVGGNISLGADGASINIKSADGTLWIVTVSDEGELSIVED